MWKSEECTGYCQESEGKRQGAVVFLHRFPEKAVLPVDHVEQTDSLQQSGLFPD